jgi:dTDP-glucose pyrophosphorylase
MILLTLAAGLGARAQQGEYIPKALIKVKDKPLAYWSMDSFHPLRTSGIIPNDKLFMAVRKADLESFNFIDQISAQISSDLRIIELQELTNGPAESAYLAISQLIEGGLISQDEPILINDCDHHFNGNRLLSVVSELRYFEDNQVLVCTADKNPIELSWSFVQESEGKVVGVVEKPLNHSDRSINYAEGLIGVYGFTQARHFMSMFERAKGLNGTAEIFISAVIDSGLQSKSVTNVKKVHIDNFTSLGTVELIQSAIRSNQLGGSFKEAGTLFIDLDGTIFSHDSGGGVGNFEYHTKPNLVSEGIPEWLQSAKAAGYSIVITTARNEKSRSLVADQLSALSIPYDQLILGLSGGPRFLFNDTKDSLACLPTAYTMNYPRNSFPVQTANMMLNSVSKLSIHNEFKGESGERTFLVQGVNGFFVRKQSQDTSNSRNIIEYQVKWFQTVNEFYPINVPKLLQTNIHSSDHLLYFDTEYVPDLMPFGTYLSKISLNHQKEKLSEFSKIMTGIYCRFRGKPEENLNYVSRVIEAKALAGVMNGFQSLHISTDMPITNSVNGRSLSDAWKNISKVLDIEHQFIKELLNSSDDDRTLIHGDPTLSNIVCTKDGRILLLDPIGTRVMPNYDHANGLGRANPIFDHSRVRLSLENEYERWSDEIVVEEELGHTNYFLPNRNENKLFDLYRGYISEYDPNFNSAVDDLIHITTLARIFPYKAKTKKKEAYYLLGLLSEMSSKYYEKYLQ